MVQEMRIGINGLGRIGKLNLKELELLDAEDSSSGSENRVVVAAINDVLSTDEIVASFNHRDQTHGYIGLKAGKISEDAISLSGKKIAVFHEADPARIPWGDYGIAVVADCTGRATERAAAEKHLIGGANYVVVSAPGKGFDKTLAMAVNHYEFNPLEHHIISNASCTTKAVAVPLKALIDYGIEIHSVIMDTTHAATNSERTLQVGTKYGVLNEIITAKTGAAIATSELIPSLEGRMGGYALRVPTLDGSFANISFVAGGDSLEQSAINYILEEASCNPKTLGRLDYNTQPEVSSTDIIGNTASSVIVASQTRSNQLPFYIQGDSSKPVVHAAICSGYDNELGPSRDLAMLVRYVALK